MSFFISVPLLFFMIFIFDSKIALWPVSYTAEMFSAKMLTGKLPRTGRWAEWVPGNAWEWGLGVLRKVMGRLYKGPGLWLSYHLLPSPTSPLSLLLSLVFYHFLQVRRRVSVHLGWHQESWDQRASPGKPNKAESLNKRIIGRWKGDWWGSPRPVTGRPISSWSVRPQRGGRNAWWIRKQALRPNKLCFYPELLHLLPVWPRKAWFPWALISSSIK